MAAAPAVARGATGLGFLKASELLIVEEGGGNRVEGARPMFPAKVELKFGYFFFQ